jgi:hypothetical protein
MDPDRRQNLNAPLRIQKLGTNGNSSCYFSGFERRLRDVDNYSPENTICKINLTMQRDPFQKVCTTRSGQTVSQTKEFEFLSKWHTNFPALRASLSTKDDVQITIGRLGLSHTGLCERGLPTAHD